jgi:hypothetical protein
MMLPSIGVQVLCVLPRQCDRVLLASSFVPILTLLPFDERRLWYVRVASRRYTASCAVMIHESENT